MAPSEVTLTHGVFCDRQQFISIMNCLKIYTKYILISEIHVGTF